MLYSENSFYVLLRSSLFPSDYWALSACMQVHKICLFVTDVLSAEPSTKF